jgi:hypothetical protein
MSEVVKKTLTAEQNDTKAPPVERLVMPLQPIIDGRFVENSIVSKLLELAPVDLNDIGCMNFAEQERMQFAQLIGYSVSGFGDLSYVNDETYDAASRMAEYVIDEDKARNDALREQLTAARKGVRDAATALFRIHPDDLEA